MALRLRRRRPALRQWHCVTTLRSPSQTLRERGYQATPQATASAVRDAGWVAHRYKVVHPIISRMFGTVRNPIFSLVLRVTRWMLRLVARRGYSRPRTLTLVG